MVPIALATIVVVGYLGVVAGPRRRDRTGSKGRLLVR